MHLRISLHALIGTLAFAVPALSAQSESAFTISPSTYSAYVFIGQSQQMLERNHQLIFGESVEASLRRGPGAAGARGSLVTRPVSGSARSSSVPRMLASSYPDASRAEVEKLFRELMRRYVQIEDQFQVPHGDLAGAAAAFIAGNWMGYRNEGFPDANFKPLVEQMRGIISGSTAFAQASDADKREAYEQLVIIGMLTAGMQMALKEQPNPQILARLKEASGGYLQQLLGAEPSRVQISERGFSLR